MHRLSFLSKAIFPCFLLFFCLDHEDTAAQRTIDSVSENLFLKYGLDGPVNKSHQYYICISPGENNGIEIIRHLSENIVIVQLTSNAPLKELQTKWRLVPANDQWKLSPSLERSISKPKSQYEKYIVSGGSAGSVSIALKNIKGVSIIAVNIPARAAVIRCKPDMIDVLMGLSEISFIDVYAAPHTETNIIGYDRSFHGINAIDFLIPGANGKNIVAGVKEQRMDDADPDLWKRVLPSSIEAATSSYHATVIASIIGGAGNSSYEGKGIAPACKFFPSSFSNLFADDATVLNINNVFVQNHSYGTVIQQHYGAEALSYDQLTWNNKQMVPVISSGNQGSSAASEGQYANIPGFANLTGNFKMAKNVITVGAIDNKNIIASLSSSGPLYDGRLAPQLIALGPNGTSDAAAMVSGTIAVMQQVYADSNNSIIPPASLVKAILFTTADDVANNGIDYKTGYGILNSYEAVRTIQKKQYDAGSVSQAQQWTKTITVPANTGLLKVTLAWTDTAATVNNNKALINDLDLVVEEINTGNEYKPWVLNAAANKDSLLKLPVRKRDSLNTTEQVSISLPSQGNYVIKVNGTSITNPSIPFHIAFKIDTLYTFRFTNPVHTADVNPANEDISVKWKVSLADTNQTGGIYISYNSGLDWELISQPVKLHREQFTWKIKDTSSVAMLRMNTSFGSFFSNSFIISDPLSLKVDFNCADSFRISWRSHVYANAYKLYTLTDSPYLKHILTTSDTFAVLQKAVYPSLLYAAEPVLTNNIPATRSQAVNIDLQGVLCFYKALNYILLDTNRLQLSLELTATSYIDSIYFERVTANGALLEVYGGAKVLSGISTYYRDVKELLSGTTYIRGKIKLKNGAVLFTDIISVTSSGSKKILFYPNPAPRSSGVSYVFEQGLSSGTQLLLFDVSGRLVRSVFIGESINAGSLSAGVFIYRLVDENRHVLETGKLVLQ